MVHIQVPFLFKLHVLEIRDIDVSISAFIGMEEEWSGMATYIQFGSDTFKTWDDVAMYFERLGGQ